MSSIAQHTWQRTFPKTQVHCLHLDNATTWTTRQPRQVKHRLSCLCHRCLQTATLFPGLGNVDKPMFSHVLGKRYSHITPGKVNENKKKAPGVFLREISSQETKTARYFARHGVAAPQVELSVLSSASTLHTYTKSVH